MLVVGGGDLRQRTASALVLVPLALVSAYFGGFVFAVVWTAASVAVLSEWTRVAALAPQRALVGAGGVALALAAAALASGHQWAGLIILFLGAATLFALARPGFSARGWAAGGMFASAAAALPVIALRGGDSFGLVAVLFLMAVVWATDIAAYFVGRSFGGPKLWPRLSPNKTWSGAVGGTLAGVLAGVGVAEAAGLSGHLAIAGLSFLVSLAGQGGDLAESAFKRRFGVKDAGHLIPGHGGLMDRLDGFAVAAVVALLVALARNAGHPATGLMVW